MMKNLIPAAVILAAGCNRAEQPRQPQAAPPRVKSVTTATLEANLARSYRDQSPPLRVPPTTRTIGPFLRLKPAMTRREVIGRVGMPDKVVGSGLYIDIYRLSDGSTVTLGSGGHLIYAYHKRESGKVNDLLKGKKAIKTERPSRGP